MWGTHTPTFQLSPLLPICEKMIWLPMTRQVAPLFADWLS